MKQQDGEMNDTVRSVDRPVPLTDRPPNSIHLHGELTMIVFNTADGVYISRF